MRGWRPTSWGEICTLAYGKSIKGYQDKREGYPVYGTNGPIGYWDTPLQNESGLIIGRKGAYRGVHYSNGPFFVIDTAYALKTSNEVDTRWAYYSLLNVDINSMDSGSAIPSTSREDFYGIPVHLPPLPEQREIAGILGALDDKIELNRRMAATLEEMARSLYRSWFVDFDPVHAKAAGHPPAHMDKATAALFPDRFGDDGLPEGWRMVGLPEIATFLNGAALQKFPEEEGIASLPVIKIAELRNGVTPKSGRATSRIPEKYLVNNGDVLFSWSGSLLQKVWTEGQGALNQHLFKVTSDIVPKWFHFFGVDQHMEDFQLTAQSKATTMGHIQRHHLDDAKVCLPPDNVLSAADVMVQPIFEKAIAVQLENQTLATLRDSLLPRLMSGELRVGAAREQIEEYM